MSAYRPLLPLLLSVFLLGVTACATNPATGKDEFVMMSEKQELELGQQYAAQIMEQMPILPKNDPLAQYVNYVGQKVAKTADRKELFYHFYVVDDDTINAFALPGGYIFVHRGLINHFNTEAELAAVLGHELGHVTARHAVQQYTKIQGYQLGMGIASIFVPIPQAAFELSNVLAGALISGFGRENELQSDELSIKYLQAAGYDVHATERILQTLHRLDEIDTKERTDAGEKVEKYHGAFSSHPETKKRIEEVVAKTTQNEAIAIDHHSEMLKAVEGYPYGDSPDEGAAIGQHFIHPKLGIQLDFPDNWVIKNTKQALTARLRQQQVYFMMTAGQLQKRYSAKEVLESMFPKRHMGVIRTGRQSGFEYASVIVDTSALHVSQATILATVWLDGSRVFRTLLWCERGRLTEYLRDFDAINASFRRYDQKRDGDVPRIRLHTWKAGDSWKKLAIASNNILGRFTAERLAALNGFDADKQPRAGYLIKIVR